MPQLVAAQSEDSQSMMGGKWYCSKIFAEHHTHDIALELSRVFKIQLSGLFELAYCCTCSFLALLKRETIPHEMFMAKRS